MIYFGVDREQELDLLSADASVWQLVNSADVVSLIANEERVKVWRVSKHHHYDAIVKFSTLERANRALDQIASEHRASTILSHNSHRSALLVLTLKTTLVPGLGAFSISPYAGESVEKMRRTTWCNYSPEQLERLCQKLAMSLLMTEQEYEKQARRLGGQPGLLHKDLKPENVCYVKDKIKDDREFFRPIDYGGLSSVDKKIWVNVRDLRYIDPQMAQYHAKAGRYAAQYENGLKRTTFPSTDIFLIALTVVYTYLGYLPPEIDYNLYGPNRQDAYFEAVWRFRWKDCPELATMPQLMRGWLLKALAFDPAARWGSPFEAMQHPWLSGQISRVLYAVGEAKQAWDEAVQEIKADLRGNRSSSGNSGSIACSSSNSSMTCSSSSSSSSGSQSSGDSQSSSGNQTDCEGDSCSGEDPDVDSSSDIDDSLYDDGALFLLLLGKEKAGAVAACDIHAVNQQGLGAIAAAAKTVGSCGNDDEEDAAAWDDVNAVYQKRLGARAAAAAAKSSSSSLSISTDSCSSYRWFSSDDDSSALVAAEHAVHALDQSQMMAAMGDGCGSYKCIEFDDGDSCSDSVTLEGSSSSYGGCPYVLAPPAAAVPGSQLSQPHSPTSFEESSDDCNKMMALCFPNQLQPGMWLWGPASTQNHQLHAAHDGMMQPLSYQVTAANDSQKKVKATLAAAVGGSSSGRDQGSGKLVTTVAAGSIDRRPLQVVAHAAGRPHSTCSKISTCHLTTTTSSGETHNCIRDSSCDLALPPAAGSLLSLCSAPSSPGLSQDSMRIACGQRSACPRCIMRFD